MTTPNGTLNRMACGGCAPLASDAGRIADGIGRRTFLVQSALLAAAAALAACTESVGPSAPTLAAGTSINVKNYSTLATVGGIATVTVSGAQLAIVRTSATAFVALSRICPHQGGIVNQDGDGFLCPNHGAQFSASGQWVGGQQTSSLHAYTTSYDAATGILSIS